MTKRASLFSSPRPHQSRPRSRRQSGIVLVASLLIMLVITLLGLSMFRSFGTQERIAGNTREKQRALHAAETARQHAEWWLTQSGNASTGAPCTALLSANANQTQVCSNAVPDAVTVPWTSGASQLGITYTPPNNVMNVSTTGGLGTYYAIPRFYIYYMGLASDGMGSLYQITAAGYGGNSNAVAVVQSVYYVSSGVKDLGGM